MEMTIKQLVNQLSVSKTTISKAISALGLQGELKRSGNKYLLSDVQIENQKALIEVLQKQLALLNEQLGIKDDQIRAYQEQIRILTDSLHDATTALSAEQALHAGTIQRQLAEQSSSSKEDVAAEDQAQSKVKQGFFSKFFGKKE